MATKKKEVAVETKEEVKKPEACSNCDDSGKTCSVCHAGLDVV